MDSKKKIFLLLPDGVGLRNFVFSDFINIGNQRDFETVIWNSTAFDLNSFGHKNIELSGTPSPKTDLLKRANIDIQLTTFELQTKNPVFSDYRFPASNKTLKQKIKNRLVKYYNHRFQNNLVGLRNKMQQSERNTLYYRECIKTLNEEKPAMVFCTNQRPVNAIAPIIAAHDLGIPTATFIFSWDNLPKATMVVDTDYYFVWSELMRNELLFYYPHIRDNQIIITGTPQFEMHFDKNLFQNREEFCRLHNLEESVKYICFSGDDITTSPHDPEYLEDTAKAIRELNKTKKEWGILFRRCPVDFSDRFDTVLTDYKEEITVLPPKWEKMGASWNMVLPTIEDNALLVNTIRHSALVMNVGSSMAFDAVCHNIVCAYIRYNPSRETLKKDIFGIYKYIHFQSMPEAAPVLWIDSPEQLKGILVHLDTEKAKVVPHIQAWFQTINHHPPQKASELIWEGIEKIIT